MFFEWVNRFIIFKQIFKNFLIILFYFYRQTGVDLQKTHEFGVITGALDINQLSSEGVIYHTISTVYTNSQYSFTSKLNDIALVKLADPIQFDETTAIICLASEAPKAGEILTITGWGTSTDPDDMPYTSTLRQASVATECDSFCEVTNVAPVIFNADVQFCAAQNMMGFCNGDTGGPAFSKNGTVYTQYGIISHQKGCGLDPNQPGIYTKIPFFKSWIQNTIGKCLVTC